MPVNPDTGLYNVTYAEREAARVRQMTLDITLVRQDGTLTAHGQEFVANERRARCMHDDVEGDDAVPTNYRCADCGDTWNGGAE